MIYEYQKIEGLVKIANSLDDLGYHEEADQVDCMIKEAGFVSDFFRNTMVSIAHYVVSWGMNKFVNYLQNNPDSSIANTVKKAMKKNYIPSSDEIENFLKDLFRQTSPVEVLEQNQNPDVTKATETSGDVSGDHMSVINAAIKSGQKLRIEYIKKSGGGETKIYDIEPRSINNPQWGGQDVLWAKHPEHPERAIHSFIIKNIKNAQMI